MKIFSGKVKDFSNGKVVVVCPTHVSFEAKSEFAFQVYGNGFDAHFSAVYSGSQIDESSDLPEGVALFNVEHRFRVTTEVKLRKSEQEARYCPKGMVAQLSLEGIGEIPEASVIDVSFHGFAVMAERHFRKGDVLQVTVTLDGNEMHGKAEVRYSLRDRNREGYHKLGLKIVEMDRISGIRWRQTVLDLIEASHHEGEFRFAS